MDVDDKPPEEQNAEQNIMADEINDIGEKKEDKKNESNKKSEAGGVGSISEETETKYEVPELTIVQEDRENEETDEKKNNSLKETDLEDLCKLIIGLENGEETSEEKNNSQETDEVNNVKLKLAKHLEDVNKVKDGEENENKINISDEQNMNIKDDNNKEMDVVENNLPEIDIKNIEAGAGEEDKNSQATEKADGKELQDIANQYGAVAGPSHDHQDHVYLLNSNDSRPDEEGSIASGIADHYQHSRFEINEELLSNDNTNNDNSMNVEESPSDDSESNSFVHNDHYEEQLEEHSEEEDVGEFQVPFEIEEDTLDAMKDWIRTFIEIIDDSLLQSVRRIINEYMPWELSRQVDTATFKILVKFARKQLEKRNRGI